MGQVELNAAVARKVADLDQPETGTAEDIGSLARAALDALPVEDRKTALTLAGRQIARTTAAQIVNELLTRSGLSLREVQARSGFEPAMISRIATQSNKRGPDLWTLHALAEALGYRLDISVKKA